MIDDDGEGPSPSTARYRGLKIKISNSLKSGADALAGPSAKYLTRSEEIATGTLVESQRATTSPSRQDRIAISQPNNPNISARTKKMKAVL